MAQKGWQKVFWDFNETKENCKIQNMSRPLPKESMLWKIPNIKEIRELTLIIYAIIHPVEISGKSEKTITNYVSVSLRKGQKSFPSSIQFAATTSPSRPGSCHISGLSFRKIDQPYDHSVFITLRCHTCISVPIAGFSCIDPS